MKRFATFIILTAISLNIMAQQKIVQTAGRTQLGEFAPEFAHLNDDILFGEVWSRNDLLSLRDRSLVTITSLISQGITDNSLKYHLQSAKNNGITRTEAAEIITHIAFYAGWPKACKGGMERRCERSRRQGCFPARDDIPYWRT